MDGWMDGWMDGVYGPSTTMVILGAIICTAMHIWERFNNNVKFCYAGNQRP